MKTSVFNFDTPTTLIRSFLALATIKTFEARRIEVYDSSYSDHDITWLLNHGDYDRFSIRGDDAGTMYIGGKAIARIVGYDGPMSQFAVVDGLAPHDLDDEDVHERDQSDLDDLDSLDD